MNKPISECGCDMIEIVCVTVNHSYQTLNVFFLEKVLENKNINKKVLKTLGFQHFLIWQGYKDSNLGHAVLETADKILCNPHEYYVFGQGDWCVLQFVLQFLKTLFYAFVSSKNIAFLIFYRCITIILKKLFKTVSIS